MPILTFEGGPLAPEMKQELITGLTEVAAKATGIPKDKFVVLLRELDPVNIGVGGVNLEEILRQRGVGK